METEETGYFGALALDLLDRGYPVLPIEPGSKAVRIDGWQRIPLDRATVSAWAGNGRAQHGVGIRLGGHLAAIDIDVRDRDIVKALVKFALARIGDAPVRVGQPPKALMLLRVEEETRKLYSKKFRSPDGATHRLEVLGQGQQFVAYHIHPDTHKPYVWHHDRGPLQVQADELPTASLEDLRDLIAEFERLAIAQGWEDVAAGTSQEAAAASTYNPPAGADPAALRKALSLISADDYHTWIDYGQALFHEFNGSDEGLDIWDEWSASAPNYAGRDTLESKWHSFHGLGWGATITVRSIFFRAKEMQAQANAKRRQQQANSLAAGELPDLSPLDIPPRQWVLGKRLLASYVTATFAPGGVAKSTLSLLTAVSIATGQELTGEQVHTPGAAWVINNEDDTDELLRRLAAICLQYDLDWSDLKRHLRINSGYGNPYALAVTDLGGHIAHHPNVQRIIEQIRLHDIRYLVLDPFISTHDSDENDNVAVNKVMDAVKHIAGETGVAIEIVHHTRKSQGGEADAHAGDPEAGRGASALKDAARIVVTLARMGARTAEELQLDEEERTRLVRLDQGKGNYALPDADAMWFRLHSVSLGQGDVVGVPVRWDIVQAQRIALAKLEAEKMDSDQQRLIDIVDWLDEVAQAEVDKATVRQVMAGVWGGLSDRQAARHIDNLVPFEKARGVPVGALSGHWLVWQEKRGDKHNSPVLVRRERIAEEL